MQSLLHSPSYCEPSVQLYTPNPWRWGAEKKRHLGWLKDLLNEEKEGVQGMLVKLFARKAVWLRSIRTKQPG